MDTMDVRIVGAGVVGLTMATVILERYSSARVTVYGEHLPGAMSGEYTSDWAGAHWRSMAAEDDVRMQEYERETFLELMRLHARDPEGPGLMTVQAQDWFDVETEPGAKKADPWFAKDLVPNFRRLAPDELAEGAAYGYGYETVTINTPHYLDWLVRRITQAGGTVVQRRFASVQEACSADAEGVAPGLVILAVGLGARRLVGLEDRAVYPTRGQTVLVRAPTIRHTWTHHLREGKIAYLIPRRDGLVILGGCTEKGDWESAVRPEMSEWIASQCIKQEPKLAGAVRGRGSGEDEEREPEPRPETATQTALSRLEVVRENCGLRPSREGGLRLEVDVAPKEEGGDHHHDHPPSAASTTLTPPPPLLAHLYGHGGSGFQSSWGSCRALLRELERRVAARHDWYQSEDEVVVNVYAKGCKGEEVGVRIEEERLELTVKREDGTRTLSLALCHGILPSASTHRILSSKIEIKLRKAERGSWQALEREVRPGNTGTATSSTTTPRPSWDSLARAWEAEEALEEEGRASDPNAGESGVNALFARIYRDADDDTKRAMVKSFQESAGTALSTNWDEVGKAKVPVSPPQGLEAKRWT